MKIYRSVTKNNQIMFPIKIVILFLVTTVVLFFWGPINYNLTNGLILFVYLILAYFLLLTGYACGASSGVDLAKNFEFDKAEPDALEIKRKKRRYNLLLFIYIVAAVLALYSRTGSNRLNFGAFNNIGAAYYARGNSNLLIERILILLSPVTTMFIPYGMVNFRYYNWFQRFFFLFAVIYRVFVDLVQGINKTFADAIIFGLIYVLMVISKTTIFNRNGKRRFKKWLRRIALLLSVLLVVFFLYFSANILSRTLNDTSDTQKGFEYLVSYLTQGYKALDYAIDLPFESTYGIGNSMYLLDYTQKWFGDVLYNRSYIGKNEMLNGWNGHVKWSSFFVWVGNDVSLVGVLPIMFLMGHLFGKTWVYSLYNRKDFSSVVLAGLLFQAAMYIPANNQIVQIQISFFGTMFWLGMWLFKRRKVLR